MRSLCFASLLVLGVLSGCESDLNHSLVHNDKPGSGNELRIPPAELGAYASQPGSTRTGPGAQGQASKPPSNVGPDFASLSPGAPCRIDLIRPAGQGQAYQGTVVRVEDKAIVLSNVFSEGPCKRSRAPNIRDIAEMRLPWTPAPTTIDWQRLPDKEVRIARSEVSSVKILDHDPTVDYYTR